MRVREEGFILKKAALPNNLSLLLVLSWLQLQVTIRATMLLLFSLQQVYVISSEVGLSPNLDPRLDPRLDPGIFGKISCRCETEQNVTFSIICP